MTSGSSRDVANVGIAIVGAGRMGRGIALSCAYAGHPVALIDSEERPKDDFQDLMQSVVDEIRGELGLLSDIDVVSADQALAIRERIDVIEKKAGGDILAQADFVFEAVTEVLEIKASTYGWLNGCIRKEAIVSSTTSTMSPDTLATLVDPSERVCNAHWLNPAHLMPLVEVCPGTNTSETTVAALKDLLERIGKVPVVCKASPGFIVSRIQAVAMNEAARLVEEGVASAEDIDKAVRTGFGVRYAILGLLEFVDWGGGDILYYASKYLADNVDKQRFSSPDIVGQHMKNGRNGLRDGRGFYDYRDMDIEAYRGRKLTEFVRLLQHLDLMPKAASAPE
jgi:3-hydroxybutyryl-CoA dehydrogenase